MNNKPIHELITFVQGLIDRLTVKLENGEDLNDRELEDLELAERMIGTYRMAAEIRNG